MSLAEGILLKHVSEVPWSNYTKADYTLEQWHNACLIHQHQGAPTAQSQCKLPVKTPNGTLNRNGVHAAAAALAGARGGVNASSEEIAAAKKAVVRFYGQLNEDPPDSLSHIFAKKIEKFLAHHGIKGQKWGVRRARLSRAEKQASASSDAKSAKELKKKARKKGLDSLSNEDLAALNKRLELEKKYNKWAADNPSIQKKAATFIAKTMIQEAQHEILGVGSPSPLGAIARNLQAQSHAAKVKQATAAGKPPPQQPGRHKGPRPNLLQFPSQQPGSGKKKNKKPKKP